MTSETTKPRCIRCDTTLRDSELAPLCDACATPKSKQTSQYAAWFRKQRAAWYLLKRAEEIRGCRPQPKGDQP